MRILLLLTRMVKCLYLYLTLPVYDTNRLRRLFKKALCILGILHFLGLISYTFRKYYDVVDRTLVRKIWILYNDYICTSSDLDGLIVFHPLHEYRVVQILKILLHRGATFIDVGAHVGKYTLLACKIVGPEGVVLALEPVPENYMCLTTNIRINNLQNIVIAKPLAAWSNKTILKFTIPPCKTAPSAKTLRHYTGLPLRGYEILCPATDLDSLVQGLKIGKIDVIKIDVEGAEVEVLKGSEGILRKYKPKIIIEIRPQTLDDVLKILKRFHYKVSFINKSMLLAI